MSLLLLLRLIGSFFYVPRLLGKFLFPTFLDLIINRVLGHEASLCDDLTSQIIFKYKIAE